MDIDNDCGASGDNADCGVGPLGCGVDHSGYVDCDDYSEGVDCEVDPAGRAFCESGGDK